MKRIAVLDDYADVSRSMADWSSLVDCEVTVFTDTVTDPRELQQRLLPFDIICLMRERTPFPASLINSLPVLKLIVTSGPRNLSIDLEAAAANNILVCGTESRKTTTSELATLMMLTLSRNLLLEVNAMQTSGWQTSLGRDLHGLSLGLIGLGKIGAQMAVLGKAFGMSVNAWSPNLSPDRCAEHDVQYQPSLPALMSASDVVSVHMVLSERSTNLIDAAAFSAMRDRAIFINTSRGPIANEDDLLAGLKQGKPWKAGLDVYAQEPLPDDSPLRDKKLVDEGRLLLSPHLGYVTEQTWQIFYSQTVDAIAAWQAGNPIRVLSA